MGKRERRTIRLQAAVKEQCAKQNKELSGAVVQHWVRKKGGAMVKAERGDAGKKKRAQITANPSGRYKQAKARGEKADNSEKGLEIIQRYHSHYVVQLHCRHKNLCDQAAWNGKLLSVQYLHKERMCSNENISRIIQFESKDC